MSRWRLNWKSPSRLRRGPRNLPHVATVVQFAWNGWINPPIRSKRAYRPGVYQRLIDLPVLAWPINFVDWEKECLRWGQSVWPQTDSAHWGGLARCKCETGSSTPASYLCDHPGDFFMYHVCFCVSPLVRATINLGNRVGCCCGVACTTYVQRLCTWSIFSRSPII
jgi:hypothetical protein